MTDWRKLGESIGTALGNLLGASLGPTIRAHYAQKYGTCRRCDRPLGGHSPEQICEPCHADELLGAASTKNETPEA